MKTITRAKYDEEQDAAEKAEEIRSRDLPKAAKGRDVENALILIDEKCNARSEAILKRMIARVQNKSVPFAEDEAKQICLEIAAVEDLRRALRDEIRAGKHASERLQTVS